MIKADMMKRRSQDDLKKSTMGVRHKLLVHPSQSMISGMIGDENYEMKDDMKVGWHQSKTCTQADSTKETANVKLLGRSRDVTIHFDICGPMPVKSKGIT